MPEETAENRSVVTDKPGRQILAASSARRAQEGVGETLPTRSAWPDCCVLFDHDTTSVSSPTTSRRMKEGQEAIYVITADTLACRQNSPQPKVFKKKGIEGAARDSTAWTSGR